MKRYTTIDELTRDFRVVSTSLPDSILKVAERLKSGGVAPTIAAAGDVIDIRGGGSKAGPSEAPKKVADKKIAQLNKRLEALTAQKMSIENMMVNLVHSFPDSSAKQIAKLKEGTSSLATAISAELKKVKAELHKASDTHVPASMKTLFDSASRFIVNTLKGEYQRANRVTLASGDGEIGMFIVLNDVDNGDGTITPQEVYGFTYDNGDIWFNPSLSSPDVPGNYNKGFQLKTTNKINEVKKLFNAQRVADGGITESLKAPPPVESVDLKGKVDGVIRSSIKGDDIIVDFNKTTADNTEAQQDAINEVQKYLSHISFLEHAKVRVIYSKPKKNSKGSQVKFSFVPSNNYSNLTVDRQETDHLRQVFPESEVRQIKKLLDNIRANPDNVVEKDYSKKDLEPDSDITKHNVVVKQRTKVGIVITSQPEISTAKEFKDFLGRVLDALNNDRKAKAEIKKIEDKLKVDEESGEDKLAPYVLVKPITGKLQFAIRNVPKAKNQAIVYLKDGKNKVDMQLTRPKKTPIDTNMPFETYIALEGILKKISV